VYTDREQRGTEEDFRIRRRRQTSVLGCVGGCVCLRYLSSGAASKERRMMARSFSSEVEGRRNQEEKAIKWHATKDKLKRGIKKQTSEIWALNECPFSSSFFLLSSFSLPKIETLSNCFWS
jgi:hypothetical protein